MSKWIVIALALSSPVVTAAPALADAPSDKGEAKSISSSDKSFLEDAAKRSMSDTQLADLAASRAASEDTKQLAQRIKADHQKIADELKTLAEKKGVKLPLVVDKSQQHTAEKLAKLQGNDFDKELATELKKDQKDAVDDFEKRARKADDADVKAWAQKSLDTLREDLKMAEDVEGKEKAGEKNK
jgi:putative membrane protein